VSLPSETMLAETPILALLMASRIPASDWLAAPRVTIALAWVPSWAKPAPL
jgi:hypothetical protein